MVFAGNSRYVFTFNLATKTKSAVLDLSGKSWDNLYITPNNNVIIGSMPSARLATTVTSFTTKT
jgi:hypothetical protein